VKNQQKKSQALTFYIVMRGGVCRLDGEGLFLKLARENEAGALFDDYNAARNAVRRTLNKRPKAIRDLKPPFRIVRLEF
jgi:hypothetical protein